MNPGDRVRMVHGREEGIVIRLLNDGLVEVEIEDGFTIPVLRSEAVIVAKAEREILETDSSNRQQLSHAKHAPSVNGLYLSWHNESRDVLVPVLVNNSETDAFMSLARYSKEGYVTLYSGLVGRKSFKQPGGKLRTEDFETWGTAVVQVIYHSELRPEPLPPLYRMFKLKASSFSKHKDKIPMLDREGFVFRIDEASALYDPEKLKAKDFTENTLPTPEIAVPLESEVDLHAEALSDDYHKMDGAEILRMQLMTFENKLSRAIAAGTKEITFIHGVGIGMLKNEIQKRLSKNPEVEYYQDAKKEKFGYGATLIKLKN